MAALSEDHTNGPKADGLGALPGRPESALQRRGIIGGRDARLPTTAGGQTGRAREAADEFAWLIRMAAGHGSTIAELDGTGHSFGCASDAWRNTSRTWNKLAEHLGGLRCPAERAHVPADHGMVEVPIEEKIAVDTSPCHAGRGRVLGGRERAGTCMTSRARPADVLAAWVRCWERAWVVAPGLGGDSGWLVRPRQPRLRDGSGMSSPPHCFLGIVTNQAEPLESALSGMHGS